MLCTVWDTSKPVGLFLLFSHTGRSATAAVFLHSVDWAAPLLWRNIFLNTSTVMLTSAIACQHDILRGDKAGMPYRMTVCQACRQETVKLTGGKKKSFLPLSFQLPLIEAVMELVTSCIWIFVRGHPWLLMYRPSCKWRRRYRSQQGLHPFILHARFFFFK